MKQRLQALLLALLLTASLTLAGCAGLSSRRWTWGR